MISSPCYSESESSFIKACFLSKWGMVPDIPEPFNLSQVLSFMYPLHRERLERILASCLLYSSRYGDTSVLMSPSHPELRLMSINLHHIPGSDPPVGETSGGEVCSRLAILYHWACPRSEGPPTLPAPGHRGRKMSASLALEKKMLSIVDVFAVFPLPLPKLYPLFSSLSVDTRSISIDEPNTTFEVSPTPEAVASPGPAVETAAVQLSGAPARPKEPCGDHIA